MKENNNLKNITLARWLIQHADKEAYRAGRLTGWKHPLVTSELYQAVGGRSQFLQQAKCLEEEFNLENRERILFEKYNMGADIRKIHYDVEIVPELCEREGVADPREEQQKWVANVEHFKEQVLDCQWLVPYYDGLLSKLRQGKIVAEAGEDLLFRCLNAVATQKEFIWERVFSVRVFDDSKLFKAMYRDRIFNILKNYSIFYIEGMEKDELFAMHEIHSYGQTLEWKGPLQYRIIEDGLEGSVEHGGKKEAESPLINTAWNRYGTVLNSQTLEHSAPVALPGCKKIMTIENKANYEDMLYREDALYIYCHGYFAPKEVKFLKGILELADPGCEFYHWGDMDLGGIRIFQFIKSHVFPQIAPYKMDVESFQEALRLGTARMLKEETRHKLEKQDAGVLQELKEIILATGKVVEQEKFL